MNLSSFTQDAKKILHIRRSQNLSLMPHLKYGRAHCLSAWVDIFGEDCPTCKCQGLPLGCTSKGHGIPVITPCRWAPAALHASATTRLLPCVSMTPPPLHLMPLLTLNCLCLATLHHPTFGGGGKGGCRKQKPEKGAGAQRLAAIASDSRSNGQVEAWGPQHNSS